MMKSSFGRRSFVFVRGQVFLGFERGHAALSGRRKNDAKFRKKTKFAIVTR